MRAEPVPLATRLSQALVAFTIEFDDLFEQRVPHTTTTQHGAGLGGGGVWLVSQAMWANYVRFLGDDTTVAELQAKAQVSPAAAKSRLNHLTWWNYLRVEPPPGAAKKPPFRDHVVRLTAAGRRAYDAWSYLAGEVEQRWRDRLGKSAVDDLAGAAAAIADPALPHYLPVVEYNAGLRTEPAPGEPAGAARDLSGAVAQALLRLTLAVEERTDVSMPVAANALRVLAEPVASRDLPARAAVSKEAAAASVKILLRAGMAEVGTDKARTVSLTATGRRAGEEAAGAIREVEAGLDRRAANDLGDALDAILDRAEFVEGLRPHDGSWRWRKPYAQQTERFLAHPREGLPRHPMVLHRGGYPDGS